MMSRLGSLQAAGLKLLDFEPTELALARLEDRPAADVGDHLSTGAHAEQGLAAGNPVFNNAELPFEVGVSFDLVDVLNTAQYDQPEGSALTPLGARSPQHHLYSRTLNLSTKDFRSSMDALRLNLGCNTDLRDSWVNVDACDYGGNAVIDLNFFPWPFDDNSVGVVYASHILEHLDCFGPIINELWRVCKNGATIEVVVPFFLSTKFYSEPDHRIPFGIRSFDNYEDISSKRLRFYETWKLVNRTNYQSPARFVVEDKRFHFSNFGCLRWLDRFINIEPVVFERFFATLLTPEEVQFRLRVVKDDD